MTAEDSASFEGVFQFSDPLESYQTISVESSDHVLQPEPDRLDVRPDSYNWWDAIPVIENEPVFNERSLSSGM